MPLPGKVRTTSHRDLQVLEAIAEDQAITQRALATRLGVAVGLVNLYMKRLIEKGFVKCVGVRPNRLRYLMTPKGVAEKARLTYEFMDYSLRLYREARQRLVEALPSPETAPRICIYVHGSTEAAELTYLALRERGLEPAAILGDGPPAFLGMPVRPVDQHKNLHYDVVVVATLDRPDAIRQRLVDAGISASKLLLLTPLRDTSQHARRTA